MPVSFEFPISLDVNQLLEFIKQIRLEQEQDSRNARDRKLASFEALVIGLALHPVSQYLVNNRYTNVRIGPGDIDVQRSTKWDQVIEVKRWGLFTETAFKDTFIDQVEAGVAARALLNVTWLLCKDGGKYGQTQIFKELQSLYSDALSCHGSFQNADKSLIRESCGKLAEEMQYPVPPSLYGKYANERPKYSKISLARTVHLYRPTPVNSLPMLPDKDGYFPDNLVLVKVTEPTRTWYSNLPEESREEFKKRWHIDVREVDVTDRPMELMGGSSLEILLVPKNMCTLWFAIVLQNVYQLGEVVKSLGDHEEFRKGSRHAALLWEMAGWSGERVVA